MPPRLWDVAAAHDWLDGQNIDIHVVGLWSDLFGYTLPADEAATWSRFVNEATLVALRGDDRRIRRDARALERGSPAGPVMRP